MRWERFRETTVVWTAAAALAVVMTYPLAFGLGRLGRLDTGDGRFSIWNVAWVSRALLHDPVHVFDANIFYPHTGTLAYSEANLVAGALGAPAYALTGNAYAAHNTAVLWAFVLSSVGMYYLARYLTRSRAAAGVAAILFAFCPFIFARTAHIQLLMTAGLPFTLLAFHRVVDRPETWRAVVLGIALWLTALACGYYGIFAGLMVSCGSLYYLTARRRWRDWRTLAALAGGTTVAALLTWPFLRPYFSLTGRSGPFRALEESSQHSANWGAYLAAAGLGDRWLQAFAGRWQEVLFPGIITLVLAAAGTWMALTRRAERGHRETVGFYLLLGAVTFWLSFGPAAGLYSLAYRWVPAFTLMRAPGRFGIMVTLALVVIAAHGLAALLARRRRSWAVAAVIGLAALVELAPIPLNYRDVPPPPEPYVLLAHLPPGPVVEFPFFYREQDFHRHTVYMLASTAHWLPLVNGYSDYFPPDFLQTVIPISSFPNEESFRILRDRRARYAVFHLNYYDRRSWPKVLARIEQYRPYLRPLVTGGDIWLFEIVGWPS
ncbi:MAG TPA: DUF6044 family protein [Vicinamibacterales bacterium]|jgi:4-amino-4-deoxy-L-arabinose transferase-like glycosyltransferase